MSLNVSTSNVSKVSFPLLQGNLILMLLRTVEGGEFIFSQMLNV